MNDAHLCRYRQSLLKEIAPGVFDERRVEQEAVERLPGASSSLLQCAKTGIEIERSIRTQIRQLCQARPSFVMDAVLVEPVQRVGVREERVNRAVEDHQVNAVGTIPQVN